MHMGWLHDNLGIVIWSLVVMFALLLIVGLMSDKASPVVDGIRAMFGVG